MISDTYLLDSHLCFPAITNDCSCLRCQFHQTLQCICGFSLRSCLQHLSHGNQGQNHSSRFKVKLMHVAHDRLAISCHLCAGHGKQGVHTVNKGCSGSQSYQGIHIRGLMKNPLHTIHKELLVDHHNSNGKQKLYQPHSYMVAFKEGWQWPVPHHMSHGHIHQRNQKYYRRNQTLLHLRCLCVLQHIIIIRLCASSLVLSTFLQGCPVSRICHRLNNGFRRCTSFHSHGVGQQTD